MYTWQITGPDLGMDQDTQMPPGETKGRTLAFCRSQENGAILNPLARS